MDKQCFTMLGISLVACRNNEGKWLIIRETDNRGWWLPGGLVDPPETFKKAAIRETIEEAGVEVEIKGILRLEYNIEAKDNYQRMKVIYYAEPVSGNATPKSKADSESEEAKWFTLKEIEELKSQKPGWRGPELYVWPKYVEDGGIIYPLGVMDYEGAEVKLLKVSDVITNKK
jgi:ADP-ribose pyrophosphatase YjhB (NUDIX family)